ncbi:MAG: cation transporter [Hyphomicrobium sp. SCN 65-11]|nr:MAG: cation transporter [Hyphomicrobium sp. SCN 65-11]
MQRFVAGVRQLAALALVLLPLAGCDDATKPGAKGAAEKAAKGAADEYERGPKRGRLLRSGDFSVEVTIFEEGADPEFHVYPYLVGKALNPRDVELTMKLTRLGNKIDTFKFEPKDDYLRGDGIVREPHSFDVAVEARYGGKQHTWSYASYEGRTTIAAEAAEAGGVKTEPAGPASIDETVDVAGRITLPPRGRAEVRARYPGRILTLTKAVGERVKQGETLVTIEASDSLKTYQIAAPISGVVVEENANVGDVTGTQPIYVITDSSKLQATFFAFPRDAEKLRVGQPVDFRDLTGRRVASKIATLLPSADANTQTVTAIADITNEDGSWRPGMAVEGTVTVASTEVPLAVRTGALQRFRDFTVVYAQVGTTYEVRMLKLGRRTPEWTEVLGGLEPGEVYVSDGAFLIRADIEKSGASHDH